MTSVRQGLKVVDIWWDWAWGGERSTGWQKDAGFVDFSRRVALIPKIISYASQTLLGKMRRRSTNLRCFGINYWNAALFCCTHASKSIGGRPVTLSTASFDLSSIPVALRASREARNVARCSGIPKSRNRWTFCSSESLTCKISRPRPVLNFAAICREAVSVRARTELVAYLIVGQ